MPIENFTVYQKAFDFFVWQKSTVKHLAKVHTYGMGIQIENEMLVLLKNIIVANMARAGKAKEIERCLVSVETLKVFFRAQGRIMNYPVS